MGRRARTGLRRAHLRRSHRLWSRRHHLRLTQRLSLLASHRVLHLLLLVLHHLLRLEALAGLGLTLGLLRLESLLPLHRLLTYGLLHPQPLQPVIRPHCAGGGSHAGRRGRQRAQSLARCRSGRRPHRLHGAQRRDRRPHALGLEALWRRGGSRSLRRAGGERGRSRPARGRSPGLRGGWRVLAGDLPLYLP